MKPARFKDIILTAIPVYVGQVATISYLFIDTVMVARYSSFDVSVLALSTAIYASVFYCLSGVLMSLAPVVSHLWGRKEFAKIGWQSVQSVYLLIACSLLGFVILWWPQPILSLSGPDVALHSSSVSCIRIMAITLPFSLAFSLYTTLITAIGMPGRAMILRLLGLLIKLPLNVILIFGLTNITAQGAIGCAIATLIDMDLMCGEALIWSCYSRDVEKLSLGSCYLKIDMPAVIHLIRLGIPIGVGYFVEISAYTMMAVFISRFGTNTLAAHQIASNIGSICYMLPMSIGIATAMYVAKLQGEGDDSAAASTGRRGLILALGFSIFTGAAVLLFRETIISIYTEDRFVQQIAGPLFIVIAAYQLFDAIQICTAFILRAYEITFAPMIVYIVSLWGFGLAGGYGIAFNDVIEIQWLHSANGFWFTAACSLALAAASFLFMLKKKTSHISVNLNAEQVS
jgi:MATE family multidrug resistance protein